MTYMLQEETRRVEGLILDRTMSPPFAPAVEEGQDEVGLAEEPVRGVLRPGVRPGPWQV